MLSVLWRCWLGGRKGIRPVKTEWWAAGVVICLERGADLHMAQLMPMPLTVSWFSKIQIDFTFLVPSHPDSPGQRAVKWVCVLLFISTPLFIITPLQNGVLWWTFTCVTVQVQCAYNLPWHSVAMVYVLLVIWMTSCGHIMARNRQREKGIYSFSQQLVLVQSVMSAIALLMCLWFL